jgi:hypothetical protein
MDDKLCPKCMGATNVMVPKTNGKKGFEYQDCTLCNATGTISDVLEEDYLLSLNEDLLETNDDW